MPSPGGLVRPVPLVILVLLSWLLPDPLRSQTGGDLDAFMAKVLTRRDDNWARLQQYVLDEREVLQVRGPGEALLYGRERKFTWYIRDGVFVRSPLEVDGAEIAEDERRRYEDEWLAREKGRAAAAGAAAPTDAASLARIVQEPRFVSAAYFLKFRFEQGRYAFVGPDEYEGRRVFRIEYYPTRLFSDEKDKVDSTTGDQAAHENEPEETNETEKARERRFERQMNKVALVTLWIEPDTHQIVQYTFDNIAWDFLPGRWLVRMDAVNATMRMGEPFEGVWLPAAIEGRGAATVASGTFDVRYRVQYRNYREADVKVRIR